MILLALACTPKVTPESTGAEAPPTRRETRAAAETAAAAPPPPQRPDLSGTTEAPDLKAGSNLELTSLTWSTIRFTIAADTTGLNTIDEASALILQRHLSADPRWRVHHRSGVLTAEQRVAVEDGWRLLPSGHHEDDVRMWRVAVRFGDRAEGDPWADAGLISVSKAGEPEIVIDGIPLVGEQKGRLATAIVVEAEQLAVEIFESAPSSDRSITATALGTLPVVLPRVVRERVEEIGYDPAWLTEAHVREGEAWAELVALESGHSEVRGWLSTPGPGWTWLRLLDEAGQPWEDAVIPAWSAERVGWGEGLFYFQAVVPTPEPFAATKAEVWHLGDGEGEEPVRLVGWDLKR